MTDRAAAAARYAAYYDRLQPETVDELDQLAVTDIRFRDPFSDFRGRDRLKALYRKMFRDLRTPRFTIEDTALGTGAVYYRWRFDFRLPRATKPWQIIGMSEVHLTDTGLVAAHLDHWDAASQVYDHIPALGFLLRRVRRRLEG